uniref:Uncharacterized protein n=1 Tax=Ananas comosus var. bracteatus TaxID=296719 RepID=A0A6V7PU27_ANACO|nr:unnamed protein product [Ananas comosus var. bracteatus]
MESNTFARFTDEFGEPGPGNSFSRRGVGVGHVLALDHTGRAFGGAPLRRETRQFLSLLPHPPPPLFRGFDRLSFSSDHLLRLLAALDLSSSSAAAAAAVVSAAALREESRGKSRRR